MEPLPAPAKETGHELELAAPVNVSLAESASTSEVLQRIKLINQVLNEAMVKDVHYGVIPGTKGKPSLLKPGAEKLCALFNLSSQPKVTVSDLGNGHREYSVQVDLFHYPTGRMVGSGIGSCSTLESKYRYKKDYQTKAKYENPDIADVYNTVLKMAKKRGLVDATLTATGASDFFTQDVEDGGILPEPEPSWHEAPKAQEPKKQPPPRKTEAVEGLLTALETKEDHAGKAWGARVGGKVVYTRQVHLGERLALFQNQQVKAAYFPSLNAAKPHVVELAGLQLNSAAAHAQAKARHEGSDALDKELSEAEMVHLGKIMNEDGVGEGSVLQAVKELGWDNRNPESLSETRAAVLRTIVKEWTSVVGKVRELEETGKLSSPGNADEPEAVEVGVEE